MADASFDDEDFDLDYDDADLSPQMRAQMDRLLLNNRGFVPGGRSQKVRHGPVRRSIEDWHETRAIQRSVDYLNDRLDFE